MWTQSSRWPLHSVQSRYPVLFMFHSWHSKWLFISEIPLIPAANYFTNLTWSTTQIKRCYLSHLPNFASLFSPQFSFLTAHTTIKMKFSRNFLFLPASLTGFPCLGSNCPGLEIFRLLLLLKLQKCNPLNQVVRIFILLISSVRSSNSHPDLLLIHPTPTFSDHTGPRHWTFTFWATTAI